jgi:hypothetical protein
MDVITHLLVAWLIAVPFSLKARDIRLIAAAGVVADIDGILILYSFDAFKEYHRVFTHNYFFFLAFLPIAVILAVNKRKVAVLAFAAFSSHILLDIFASEVVVQPFYPASKAGYGIINYMPMDLILLVITPVVMVVVFIAALAVVARKHRTPFELVSRRLDTVMVGIFTYPSKYRCRYCKRKAYYRCSRCGAYFCDRHIGRLLAMKCRDCGEHDRDKRKLRAKDK